MHVANSYFDKIVHFPSIMRNLCARTETTGVKSLHILSVYSSNEKTMESKTYC